MSKLSAKYLGAARAPPRGRQLCGKVNVALAEQISQHPTRFRGFATIPLHDPATAADEMRRCVNQLAFVGTFVMGAFVRIVSRQ